MTGLHKRPPQPSTIVPGREYRLGHAASVQFTCRELRFRVIKVLPREWDDDWCWVIGYALHPTTGEAVERRALYVQESGVKPWLPEEAPAKPCPTDTVSPTRKSVDRSSAPR